jgi:hypothetical protein
LHELDEATLSPASPSAPGSVLRTSLEVIETTSDGVIRTV